MPRKGSRRCTIGDRLFFYRISGNDTRTKLTVQSEDEDEKGTRLDVPSGGRVLQVHMEVLGVGGPLKPTEVKQIIAHSLSKGWDPNEKGAAFHLAPRTRQPEPLHHRIIENDRV